MESIPQWLHFLDLVKKRLNSLLHLRQASESREGGDPLRRGMPWTAAMGSGETDESRIIKEHRECANVRDVAGT